MNPLLQELTTPTHSKGLLPPLVRGMLATVAAILAVEVAGWVGYPAVNPTALFLLAIIYATFISGISGGVASAVVATGYLLYFLAGDGFTVLFAARMGLHLLGAAGTILLVGLLQQRAQQYDRSLLRQQRDYANALVASLQDGLIARDASGRLIEVNDSFCRMTGFTREELIGHTPPYPYWPPEELPRIQPIYENYMAGEMVERELIFCRKDGERFPVLMAASPLRLMGQARAGFVATVKDISQRKQAEEALRQRADEVAAMAEMLEKRNRELDQFAYITSHDLKAPLRGIANLSQWMEEDLGDRLPGESKKQMELLRGRVRRMEALIDGILQYSRVGRVHSEPEPVDVSQLLADVVELLDPPAGFTIEVEPGMPTLTAERLHLQQVFMNLIGNAIKHHDRADGRVSVGVRELGPWYEFRVSDDGPGIEPQYHARIFVIFQTLLARDTVEGTGVGLSLVKKIVENQGGTVSVESQEGRGSTFRFTWPRESRRSNDGNARSSDQHPVGGGRRAGRHERAARV